MALKLMEGNAGKRVTRAMALKENQRIAEAAAAAEKLSCPSSLKGDARKEWERLAPSLKLLGLLHDASFGLFVVLCEAWGRYREYEKLCAKVGAGEAVRLKYRRAADECRKAYLRASVEFGLSPSRSGQVTPPGGKQASAKGPTSAKDAMRKRMFGG